MFIRLKKWICDKSLKIHGEMICSELRQENNLTTMSFIEQLITMEQYQELTKEISETIKNLNLGIDYFQYLYDKVDEIFFKDCALKCLYWISKNLVYVGKTIKMHEWSIEETYNLQFKRYLGDIDDL